MTLGTQAKLATLIFTTLALSLPVAAQNQDITAAQRSSAEKAAQAGVPLSDLKPDAPERHTVQSGDTLWAIAGLYLQSPWRWPELWGMNLQDIQNPHRIYPGQTLVLDRSNGRATLRSASASEAAPGDNLPTVRLSPRTRTDNLPDNLLPTLSLSLIESFLSEPLIVEANTLGAAPHIVSAEETRVLLSRGDRAYARGNAAQPLLLAPGEATTYRVFRDATAVKDPGTGQILGYEAQYVGKALLVRGEQDVTATDADGKARTERVAATIDITHTKEEIRAGDRLLPEPPRQIASYSPHAPTQSLHDARIVSVYGSAVANASQNQVVLINRGTSHGVDSGTVLAIMKNGGYKLDRTESDKTMVRLPDERNGLLMVFRPFEKLSYALVMQITDSVRVGDRLVSPR
jgi:hypothetical protein